MAIADNEEKKDQLEENNAAYNNPTTLVEENLKFQHGTECKRERLLCRLAKIRF